MTEPGYREGRKWWRQGYEAGRDEVRSERDSLAHLIRRLQEFRLIDESPVDALERIGRLLDTAPEVSLREHDAEVWEQAAKFVDEQREDFDGDLRQVRDRMRAHASDLREE